MRINTTKNGGLPKIDPAFYKIIMVYIDFLNLFEHNPLEGRLNFTSHFIKPIMQKSGWQGSYDRDLRSDA